MLILFFIIFVQAVKFAMCKAKTKAGKETFRLLSPFKRLGGILFTVGMVIMVTMAFIWEESDKLKGLLLWLKKEGFLRDAQEETGRHWTRRSWNY